MPRPPHAVGKDCELKSIPRFCYSQRKLTKVFSCTLELNPGELLFV